MRKWLLVGLALVGLAPSFLASEIAPDYLKAPAKGYPEGDLPKAVAIRLKQIRVEALRRNSRTNCSVLGEGESKDRIVRYAGEVARKNNIKVFAFIEECKNGLPWGHFVVFKEGHLVQKTIELPLRFAGQIDGFPLERPLVWFEETGDKSLPFLCIREQYHNGTDNAVLVRYYKILPGPGVKFAFAIEEIGEDFVAEKLGQDRTIARRLDWDTKTGKRRAAGWKVYSVGESDEMLVGSGRLKENPDGSFEFASTKVIKKGYEDLDMIGSHSRQAE